MTSINKILIKGFKSFAKRTEIPLGRSFNCILGPNGSGKSNVCDAICFVLGKLSAKGLRAEKTANLIFHGGKENTPAKEAEVSIFFDNARKKFPLPDKEIKISRIVKRSGQSTYLINDEVRTRQQIVDLLAAANIDPDGHNIVLQGDIIRFVQMKSDERRELIEEIAGISIFEEKKDKAMKELEKVQNKLNEADIILTEREKTLSDLKKDRDQAIKFRELEKNIKRNKATSLHLQIKDKNEKKEKAEADLEKYKKNIESIQTAVDSLKSSIEQKRSEIEKINEELKEKGDKGQQELNAEISSLKEEIARSLTRKDVCENEIRKINERTRQLNQNLNEISKTISQLAKRKSTIVAELSELKSKESKIAKQIDEHKSKYGAGKSSMQNRLEELEAAIDECEKYLQEAEFSRQQSLRDKDKLALELENISKKLESYAQLKKEDSERIKRLKKARAEFRETAQELSKRLNESSVFSVQLSNARNKLMDKNEELGKLRARSIGIKEIAAGDAAVKKIKAMNIQGVFGTVGELGQVNSKYALALEVAAGARLRSVVVSSDAVAAKCIQILKESKTGVVTFLPLNKLKERIIDSEAKKLKGKQGVHGLAIDLVSYEPKFRNVFKYVFGSTVVVDNLSTARRIGIGRARMVSLDGDLVEPSGAMVGGYRRKSGLGFREKELESGITSLEDEIEHLRKEIELLEGKKTENEEAIIRLREKKALLEAEIKGSEAVVGSVEDLGNAKKEKKEIEKKLRSVESELREIEKDCSKYRAKINTLKTERQKVVEEISKSSPDYDRSPISLLEEERRSIREKSIKIESESESLTRQMEMMENEKQKTSSILNNHQKELKNFKEELSLLITKIKDLKVSLKGKESEQKKFYSSYQALFAKRAKLEKQIQKIGTDIVRQEERARGIEHRANEVSVRIALINGELEGLNKEFEEYKDVPLRRGISLGELNAEIRSFEENLRKMGNVNLRALEIYEKVNDEYKSLLEKYDKLKLEKDDVLNLMYEIETKKKHAFMKTFRSVERKFKEIFAVLYKKGEADLTLENEDDPFAGGVDIRVKIAGKKYMDIHSLSGGEKTLAALAFIFAIQEFNPAAFYLLDEVDAALDKKNSELLSKLIAKYSSKAQYIVISHNDSIINEADRIYGVSMQEGISKVVSLKI